MADPPSHRVPLVEGFMILFFEPVAPENSIRERLFLLNISSGLKNGGRGSPATEFEVQVESLRVSPRRD